MQHSFSRQRQQPTAFPSGLGGSPYSLMGPPLAPPLPQSSPLSCLGGLESLETLETMEGLDNDVVEVEVRTSRQDEDSSSERITFNSIEEALASIEEAVSPVGMEEGPETETEQQRQFMTPLPSRTSNGSTQHRNTGYLQVEKS